MRSRILRTLTPFFLACAALAAPGRGAPPDSIGSVPLLLTAPPPQFEPLEGGRGVIPRIRGFGQTGRPGEPMLPMKILRVAIPEGSVPELRIVSSRLRPLGPLRVAPVPRANVRERTGRLEDETYDPEFTEDERIFGRDAEYPASPVRLGSVGYLREQRFVEVIFAPVQLNPKRRSARYFPEVRAEVVFTMPGGGDPAAATRPFRSDPLFEGTYRRALENYEQGKLFRVPPGGRDAEVLAPQAASAPAVTAASPRYKISVSHPGVYRLAYADVQASAPDLLALDPRTLMLSAEGTEVPISIRSSTGGAGESDGRFDPDDYLEFYGRPKGGPPTLVNYSRPGFPDIFQANDFTDTQIYWLTSAGDPGSHRRIGEAGGAPGSPGFPQAADFQEAAIWDENNIYLPLGGVDPFFSIPSLLAGSTQAQRDLVLAMPGISASGTTASATLRLRGGSSLADVPLDHRTRVWFNGDVAEAADFTWDGEIIFEQNFTVTHSVLTNPTTIHVTAPGLAGVSVDSQFIDTVTIRYRRTFDAVGDVLLFSYPNQDVRFQVRGLSGSPPAIFEVTRALAGSSEADPVRITGASVSGAPPVTATFEVPRDTSAGAPATRTFAVTGPLGVLRPDAVVRAADPVLTDPNNAADILVIGTPETIDPSPGGALQSLLTHRLLRQGLSSRVVYMSQIYDEFSYGLRDPNAIRSFLSYAFDNWKGSSGTARPPSFVLLVGDATPDYKNTLPQRPDWVDQVPTAMMFHVNSILGYYSSDNWLASFRGSDQLPDVYLGRISTRSAAASAQVFDKILRYEESPPPGLWKGRAVLVAGDGKFTGEAGDFEAIEDEIAQTYFSRPPRSTPVPPLYFARSPWNSTDLTGFRNAIVTQLQSGAAVLSYIGHGGFDTWGAYSSFFNSQDAQALTNDGLLPFMVTMNCLTGGFHFLLGTGSLGEAMTNNPAGGAIATLAPSGLSSIFLGRPVIDDLFDPLYGATEERLLGAATNDLRAGLWSLGNILDLQSYTLLGDPATILATPAPPPPSGLVATPGNATVTLGWSPPSAAVAGYRIYRATSSPGGYSSISCDPISATSCVDRTAANATKYYYYAVSLDADGFEGRASNFNSDCDTGPDCVVARPMNPNPPSVPSGLQTTDPGTGGRLLVSWQPNSETDLKTYSLYYGTASGQYTFKQSYASGITSVILTGLTDGVRYYLALSATNTSGHESALSGEVTGVSLLIQGIAPPRAIDDLRVSRSGSDLILSWSRPTLDIYGRPTTVVRYNVYRGTTPGFQPYLTVPIAVINDASSTGYVDGGQALPAAGNLYYLVTATDVNGFTSGAGRDLPNGIQNLAVSMPAQGTVGLAWPAVTNDVTGYATLIDHYQVHASDHPLPRASLGSSTLVRDNVRVLTVDLSVPSSRFYFSVIAVDNRGNLSPF